MKINQSFRDLRSAVVFAGFMAFLSVSSSQAGSFVGFRDGSFNLAQSTSKQGPAINSTTSKSGPSLGRHGADDPANHDVGDDRGRHRHGAGHR